MNLPSLVKLVFISALVIICFGCSSTKKTVKTNAIVVKEIERLPEKIIDPQMTSKLSATLDGSNKDQLLVILNINSEIDSLSISLVEIQTPSFVKPTLSGRAESFELMVGEDKNLIFNFILTKNESFKLKGVVLGNTNRNNSKISKLNYLFFYWNDGKYIISDDINQILGMKKKNGDIITIEDLKIFNNGNTD